MKKKVLFILHIPPPVHGAAMVGKYIMESKAINSQFESGFVNLSTSTALDELGEKSLTKYLRVLKIQWRVLKALFSKRYDLCYLTPTAAGMGFVKDFMVILVLKLFGKKIIYHFHNKGISATRQSRFMDTLYRVAFHNTKTILLSPNLYSDFKKYLRPEDVYFCANGIPAQEPSLPVANRSNASVCRLLFLSNMIREKGVLVLLEACRLLKEKGARFECHFVGAWADVTEADFAAFVRENGLSENVFGHGPKYGSEKQKFLAASDVFILPTYYKNESFPLVLLEAMNHGLPVVSTTEGGIPDIVRDGETGLLVRPQDAGDLAAKLETLILEPHLRRKLGEEGESRFLSQFTLQQFEENIIRILDAAIRS